MSRRVLIADDEPHMSGALKALLESDGYAVDLAGRGPEAIEKLSPAHGLLIVDVTLPGKTGYEVTQEARQRFSPADLAIIVISTKTGQFSPQKARALGADVYIRKPFRMTDLRKELDRLTGLRPPAADDGGE